jgi:hypothetical protein
MHDVLHTLILFTLHSQQQSGTLSGGLPSAVLSLHTATLLLPTTAPPVVAILLQSSGLVWKQAPPYAQQ